MASVSSNWTDQLDQWSGHGSGAGLTTIKSAATTFVTAVANNLPSGAGSDVVQVDVEGKMLEVIATIANEFRS